MKKILCAVVFLCMIVTCARADVAVDAANFPDAVFRSYVSSNFDSDNNGALSDSEIAGATGIYVSGQGISSLSGIEHFTALTVLWCSNNQLSVLDVSHNTALQVLHCEYNQLGVLDVSGNTALTELHCEENQITTLDTASNTALTRLSCFRNYQLASLNLSNNTALTYLSCYNNSLSALDVSSNTALTHLACSSNQLEALDVSSNTALVYLSCRDNRLSALDVSNNTALVTLSCKGNRLAELDTSSNSALTYLSCGSQNVTPLSINSSGSASYPYQLDFSEYISPDKLANVSGVQGVDSSNANISTAYSGGIAQFAAYPAAVRYNYSTGYSVSSDAAMRATISASGKEPSSPPALSEPVSITSAVFSDDNFRSYVSNNFDTNNDGLLSNDEIANAERITLRGSNISSLKGIEHFTSLKYLDCWENNLTEIDLSHNTELVTLGCGRNKLVHIDVSRNTKLEELDVYNNESLQALDVSSNTLLTFISCGSSNISVLDLANNNALEYLGCDHNALAVLDLGNIQPLDTLYCDTQTRRGLAITAAGDSSYPYQLDLSEYISPDKIANVSSVQGFDSSDNSITSAYSEGVARFVSIPAKVTYNYSTGCQSRDMNVTISASSGSAEINAANFPDDIFRAYVSNNFDTNNDGVLSDSEIAGIIYINVPEMGIRSLKGIEYFTQLRGIDCTRNNISEIDLSRNLLLEWLGAENNSLTALNVTNNPELTGLDLNNLIDENNYNADGSHGFSTLYSQNKLTALDVTKNPKLEQLFIDGSNITSIDLSNNTKLKMFHCIGDKLSVLDVSKCPELESLLPCDNNLTALDVSNNPALISLDVSGNNITAGNFSNNTNLKFLCYNRTRIKAADVSSNPALVDLRFWSTDLEALDVRNCPNLEILHCHDSKVTSLTLGTHSKLRELLCHRNNITGALDLHGFTALKEINCRSNRITSLNLEGCTALTTVYARSNNLTGLNVTGCNALEILNCGTNADDTAEHTNRITALDLSGKRNLKELSCKRNRLTALDLTDCTALLNLSCSRNQLASLNVANCTALVSLDCGSNDIKTLDVTNNTALKYLDAWDCRLSQIDVSNNTELEYLELGGANANINGHNRLTSIDVSKNTKLKYLAVDRNQLTSLDVSGLALLECLMFQSNNISAIDLSGNTNLRELYCGSNDLAEIDLSKNTQLVSADLGTQNLTAGTINYSGSIYSINLNDYVKSGSLANVSGIQAYDSGGNPVEFTLSAGILQFTSRPERVRWTYTSGSHNMTVNIDLSQAETKEDSRVYNTFSTAWKGHKYTIIDRSMNWEEAKLYCETLGGHLATITSREEQDAVKELLQSAPSEYYVFWLGGEKTSGTWKWITGEEFSYTNFYGGQPDGSGNYLQAYGIMPGSQTDSAGYWDDASNDGAVCGLICEWEPVSAEFAPLNPDYLEWRSDPSKYYEGVEFYGENPDPADYSHLSDNPAVSSSSFADAFAFWAAENFSAKYDPRTLGKVTQVRDQGSYETCWSFASLGAMETSYVYRYPGNYAPDLSELHQAWFAYKDTREGYSFPLNEPGKGVLYQGGSLSVSLAFLSRAGTASENELPYTQAENAESLTGGKYPEDYSDPLRLKDVYIVGGITEKNRDEIKRLITEYGALRASMRYDKSGLSGTTFYSDKRGFGHAVIITGWDDDITTPSGKGAWLAKNSWNTYFADGGYFWISYSQYLYNVAAFISDKKIQGLRQRGYDQLGGADAINYQWAANVFMAEGNETIHEVAFHTHNNNVNYEIYINTLGKAQPVNPGVPATPAASGNLTYCGYHTVSINSPVNVEDGEYFSVIVKLSDETSYEYYSAVEDPVTFSGASVHVGESYFAEKETTPRLSDWKDGKTIMQGSSERPCNACIKVFTSEINVDPEPVTPTPGEQTSSSGGGGGGCSSVSGIFITMAAAFMLARKATKH